MDVYAYVYVVAQQPFARWPKGVEATPCAAIVWWHRFILMQLRMIYSKLSQVSVNAEGERKTMSIVGAIWVPSLDDCKKYGGFNAAVFICISKCGNYMAGSAIGIVTRPDVGDTMPAQITVSANETIVPESWDIMCKAALCGKLGKPKCGVNPFNVKRASDNQCTCGTTVVMNGGCVSNRGLPCPRTPDPPTLY